MIVITLVSVFEVRSMHIMWRHWLGYLTHIAVTALQQLDVQVVELEQRLQVVILTLT